MIDSLIISLKENEKIFISEGLQFKLIALTDIELLRVWRNKEENRNKFIFNGVISEEQQINWYNSYQTKTDDLMFIVSDLSDNRPFAAVALYCIDYASHSAEFGRLMIGESEYKGRSLGGKITSAVVSYAFTNLDLSEVYLEVFSDNDAAIKTYTKSGFNAISCVQTDNKSITKMLINKSEQ